MVEQPLEPIHPTLKAHIDTGKEFNAKRPTPVLVLDRRGTILEANPQSALDYGSTAEELEGKNVVDLFSEGQNKSLYSLTKATIRASRQIESANVPTRKIKYPVAEVKTKEGETRFIEYVPKPIASLRSVANNTKIEGFEIECIDVTDRELARRNAEALVKTSNLLNKNLELTGVLTSIQEIMHEVVAYDTANIMLIEPGSDGIVAISSSFGYKSGQLENPQVGIPVKHINERQATLKRVYDTKQQLVIADTSIPTDWIQSINGYNVVSYACVSIIYNDKVIGFLNLNSQKLNAFSEQQINQVQAFANQIGTVVNKAREHEELKKSHAHVELLSITDELTGLFNRRYFNQALRDEIRRAIRFDRDLGFCLGDADTFSDVNDIWDHQVGDEALKVLAEKYKKRVRKDLDIPVRYGGEEMALILPETNLEGSIKVAEDLRQDVYEMEPIVTTTGGISKKHNITYSPGGKFNFSTTIGVATLKEISPPSMEMSREEQVEYYANELIALADQRLKRGKNELGRNVVVSL